MGKKYFIIALLLISISSLGQTFQNVATARGINFRNQVLTANGGGVSFVDFDQDGLDDITLGSGLGHPLKFYKNTGGSYMNITAPVNFTGEAQQIIWVDFDNDGDKDLYISDNLGPNKLFRNNGSLSFTDISIAAGLSTANSETYGVAWGDINRDGWLDFYECNQLNFGGGNNKLYLSNGNSTFQEIAFSAGVADSLRYTFSAVFLDYDLDGFPDLYVANDRHNLSSLYRNMGDSTFQNVSVATNAGLNIDGMGLAVADYDNNGYPDIYVTNTMMGNKLLRHDGVGTFTEVASTMGVTLGAESWGANFFDADHDGDLDLYVSDVLFNSNRPSERFFRNDDTIFSQNGNFANDTVRGFANAIGDFNNDGFYDVISPSKFPFYLQLWECNGLSNTNWIKLKLEGTLSNRDGIGSLVEVFAGSDVYRHYTQCGNSYLGQNSNTFIIGLDTNQLLDSVRVKWLSGHTDLFPNLAINTTHLLKEGKGLDTTLQVSGALRYCKGDSIQVSLNAAPGYADYLWNTGDTTSGIIVSSPGLYQVFFNTSLGFSDSSRVVEIIVDSLTLSYQTRPDTNLSGRGMATVQVSGGTPPYVISWNDSLMQSGDTATALAAGNYKVYITDSAGCSDSLLIPIGNVVGMDENPQLGLQVYPQPFSEIITISTPYTDPCIFKILDLRGQCIIKGDIQLEKNLNLTELQGGVYILQIMSKFGEIRESRILIKKKAEYD